MNRPWMVSCFLLLSLSAVPTGAAAVPEQPGFRYMRTVTPSGKGPHRLEVDPALMGGAQPLVYAYTTEPGGRQRAIFVGGLEDLRLYDEGGNEHPYRIMPPPGGSDPVQVSLKFERREGERGTRRFAVYLPEQRLPLLGLRLGVRGEGFVHEARVSETRQQGEIAEQVSRGLRLMQDLACAKESVTDFRVPITRPQGALLELLVVVGEDPSCDLVSLAGELAPLPWIYWESADGEPLVARFGNPELRAPSYSVGGLRGPEAGVEILDAKWGPRREAAGDRVPTVAKRGRASAGSVDDSGTEPRGSGAAKNTLAAVLLLAGVFLCVVGFRGWRGKRTR